MGLISTHFLVLNSLIFIHAIQSYLIFESFLNHIIAVA